ncbi:MAG: hypothetical protein JRJ27_07055 [Deltaproteobacteria bacterium]|nr:hypothetical protein [Deltaproteobacteria bacterium]
MKRLMLTTFLVGLFFFAQGIVVASEVSDFKYQAPVKGEEKQTVSVRLKLPHEIIKNTSAGFKDLRLFDDTGVEIPYVIYAQSRPKETPKYFTWEIVNYHYTDTTQTIVLKKPRIISMARGLRISTKARDFAKEVKLYTSQDQKTWELLTTGSFFDFSSQVDFRKNEIKISEITGQYLKVALTDTVKPITGEENMRFQYKDLSFSLNGTIKGEIKINNFTSYIGKKSKEKYLHDEFGIQSPKTFIDKDGNTIVVLGELNVPADKISLSIKNPYFYRQAELWIAEKDIEESYRAVGKNVLYRIPGISETKTTLPAHFIRPAHARLKIINKDNPPLAIENAKIKWVRRNLYFIPEKDRSYTMYWDGLNITRPDYELKKMISNQYDALLSYDEWTIGNIQKNGAYAPRADELLTQRVQKYLFIGLVLLLVVGLGFWVFKLVRKMLEDKQG